MTPGEITCKATPHSCRTGMRYPLLMTSSILNGWQGKRYENEYIGHDPKIAVLPKENRQLAPR